VGSIWLVRHGALKEEGGVVLGQGRVVGALDCLRGAPHSFPVRTSSETLLDCWDRKTFMDMIGRDVQVARAFISAELGTKTGVGRSGSAGRAGDGRQAGTDSIRRLVEEAKHGLRLADGALRGGEPTALAELHAVLDGLVLDLIRWEASSVPEAARLKAVDFLVEELEPYLIRSPLAAAMLRHTSPVLGDPVVAEALGRPPLDSGDGLGNALESWVRARPGLEVLSHTDAALVEGCVAEGTDNEEILVFAGGMMHLARRLVMRMAECTALEHAGITLFTEDRKRADQLAGLGAGYNSGQRWLGEVWSLANSRTAPNPVGFGPFDIVVIPHLLEFLPSRHIVSMLKGVRGLLKPSGQLLVSTLSPGDDSVFLDAVLGWPTVRRDRPELMELFLAAELAIVGEVDCPDPAIVIAAMDLESMA